MTCGIYAIINIVNEKYYIGSSNNIESRISKHFSELNSQKHDNNYLQKSYNKYEKDNFIYVILEVCTKEELIIKEQCYIESLKSCNRNKGYNIRLIANSNIGVKYNWKADPGKYERTQEIKDKTSATLKGRKISKDIVEKIRKANKGKTRGRDFILWPHDDGIKCKCRECRDKINLRTPKYKLRYREKLKAAKEITYGQ